MLSGTTKVYFKEGNVSMVDYLDYDVAHKNADTEVPFKTETFIIVESRNRFAWQGPISCLTMDSNLGISPKMTN